MPRRFCASAAFMTLLSACAATPPDPPARELQVGVLLLEDASLLEVAGAFEVFGQVHRYATPGMRVFAVGCSAAPSTTREGLSIAPTYTLDDAPSIDVLVVPSGKPAAEAGLLADWIRTRAATAEVVMSVGRGAFLLGEAGLLDGRVCTATLTDRDEFKSSFPTTEVRPELAYVIDGKFATCRGGAQRHEAAMWLVKTLYGDAAAYGVRDDLGLDWSAGHAPHVVVVR